MYPAPVSVDNNLYRAPEIQHALRPVWTARAMRRVLESNPEAVVWAVCILDRRKGFEGRRHQGFGAYLARWARQTNADSFTRGYKASSLKLVVQYSRQLAEYANQRTPWFFRANVGNI